MVAYDSMSRAELIETIRSLEARLANAASGVDNPPDDCAKFPVFGERERREFETSPWPIRIFDRDTTQYLAVNDAALTLYGYTREEFLELRPLDTRPPEERSEFYTTLAEPTGYLRHRGPRRHLKKSGEIIVVEIVTQDIIFNGRAARLSLTLDVTERVRMETLLRKREQEFSALVENAPDVITRFDRELRHVYVNPAMAAATGFARGTFIGKTHRELGMPEPLVAFWEQEIRRVFDSGEGRRIEFECPCHGGIGYFEARTVPEFGPDGAIETALTVARDITERVRAEHELMRRKKLLEAVFDNLPVGVFIKDAKTSRFVMRNRFSQETFGYPAASFIGKTSYDLFPKEQADQHSQTDREVLETGRMVDKPAQAVLGKTGDIRIQHVRKVPVFDESGEPWVIVGISDDITERKRAETALRESEERFRQLAENIREVFWISSPSGDEIIYVSPAYEELWGESCASLYRDPRSWMNAVHPEDRQTVTAYMRKITDGERPAVEYRIVRPDGSPRWIRDRCYSMTRGDGAPLVCGVAEDITESKRAQEKRIADVMRQRDALVREVHHRVKNKLQGLISLLRRKMGKRAELAPILESAISQLQSVATIYGLQSRSDFNAGADLQQILEAICDAVAELTGAVISRRFDGADMSRTLVREAEAVPLALVLNELIFNAQKHMTAGNGQRTIKVGLFSRLPGVEVRIANRGRLPTGFGSERTGGLALVRTLLAPTGAHLAFHERDGVVEAVLKLSAALLVVPEPHARARRRRKHEVEVS